MAEPDWPFPAQPKPTPLPPGPWKVVGVRAHSMRRQWGLERKNPNGKFPYGVEPLVTPRGNRKLFLSEDKALTECEKLNTALGVEGVKR